MGFPQNDYRSNGGTLAAWVAAPTLGGRRPYQTVMAGTRERPAIMGRPDKPGGDDK
jgi:hypothetical protein